MNTVNCRNFNYISFSYKILYNIRYLVVGILCYIPGLKLIKKLLTRRCGLFWAGVGKVQDEPEHFVVPEGQDVLKASWDMSKGHNIPAASDSHWPNLRIF